MTTLSDTVRAASLDNFLQLVSTFCKQAGAIVQAYQHRLKEAKVTPPDFLWVNPTEKAAYLQNPSTERVSALEAMRKAGQLESITTGPQATPPGFGEQAWMPVKMADALRPLFSAVQLAPNIVNRYLGGPTPIAASIGGSLLGAGLGYGAGWLGEKLMGEGILRPGRLRRTGAIAGGLLGAAPGAYLGTVGMRANSQQGKNPWRAWIEPEQIFGAGPEYNEVRASVNEEFLKRANEAGGMFIPSIPVDSFNRVIWEDPSTPLGVRAAVTGLVEGASQSQGGVDLVSPWDVGRIAIGMGSGLLSGMVVGKVLGALAGLTPSAQNTLQQTGMWAGALTNVVPRAFGY